MVGVDIMRGGGTRVIFGGLCQNVWSVFCFYSVVWVILWVN